MQNNVISAVFDSHSDAERAIAELRPCPPRQQGKAEHRRDGRHQREEPLTHGPHVIRRRPMPPGSAQVTAGNAFTRSAVSSAPTNLAVAQISSARE